MPKAVFYQVQGEKKRRSGLAKDPSKLRFGNRLALNGRLICGKCGRTLKRYVKAQEELTDWRCRQRALVKKTDEGYAILNVNPTFAMSQPFHARPTTRPSQTRAHNRG